MGKAIIILASCLYRSVEERFLTWLIPRRRQFESDRCKEYGAKPPRGVFWVKLICTIVKIYFKKEVIVLVNRIYKIENDINDKVYIGKTTLSLEKRFKQHCEEMCRPHREQRPLYSAMKKYGKEHFSISLLEECPSNISSEREQYWIKYFKGYEKGYNATRGGDGKILYNYEEIERLLKQGMQTSDICKQIGCCADIVYKVAKNCGYVFQNCNELQKYMEKSKIKVKQFDLQGNFIQEFDSYASAARWLYEIKKIRKISGGVRSHIGEVCDGIRKTAYGYIWKKAN